MKTLSKTLFVALVLWVLSVPFARAQINFIGVFATTNGVLIAPTNLFLANMGQLTNALNIVGYSLVGTGNAYFTNLNLLNPLSTTNLVTPTNFPAGSVLSVGAGGAITYTNIAGLQSPSGNGGALTNLQATNMVGQISLANNNALTLTNTWPYGSPDFIVGSTAPPSGALYDTGFGYDVFQNYSGAILWNCTAFGAGAMQGVVASGAILQFNSAFGSGSLQNLNSGNNNSAMSCSALQNLVTGSLNSVLGNSAIYITNGNNNVIYGDSSANSLINANSNIIVGASIGNNLTTGSGNIYVGGTGSANESNITRIGTSQTACYIAGNLVMPTNSLAVAPGSILGKGILWNSNNALYWITPSHTNYVTGP